MNARLGYQEVRNYIRIARDVVNSDPEDEAALLSESVRPLLAWIDQQAADIKRTRDLIKKWETEQAAYPGSEQGLAAAAAVRLCARELGAALDGDAS